MLYYIHGYLSSPDSTKAMILKKELDVKSIKYRNCAPEELVINECVEEILKEIKDDEKIILIGSSLGGLLSVKTALKNPYIKHLILINPALIPPNYNTSKITDMPQRILKEMQDEKIYNKKIKAKIDIIIGINDEVVPNIWSEQFAEKQDAEIHRYDDDHRFSKNIEKLPDIIKDLI